MENEVKGQAGCFENTQALHYEAKAEWLESRVKGRAGMAPRPKGEESEALNRAAFASLGQKRRAFEPLCLSYSNGFLNHPA